MLLYFSVQSLEGEQFSHSFCSSRLEHHLDILNDFVATGHRLLNAYMEDQDGKRFDLPLEAFDGQPVGDHLLELEREYYQVLQS